LLGSLIRVTFFTVFVVGSELDDEVVDIGENEHPTSSISPVTIEKDLVLGNSNGIFSFACLY